MFQRYKHGIFLFDMLTLSQAKDMLRTRIEYKENQIKIRKIQLDAGKFESITELIEIEVRNLQRDIEFLKALEIELDS